MNTLREEKNQRIKDTMKETFARRKRQIPIILHFGVRNEKRNKKAGVFEHFGTLFVEAKWVWNSIVGQSSTKIHGESARKLSSFKQQEFKTVIHKDFDGNDVTDTVTCLTSSMRDSMITRAKRSVKGLKTKKDKVSKKKYKAKTDKVGHLKFKSEIKSIELKQYGITHYMIKDNVYHIQGLDADIRVAGEKQLRQLRELGIEFEFSSAVFIDKGGKYYIDQIVYVDEEQYNKIKESKKSYKREQNAFDFGCKTTLTDAEDNEFNYQVEEPGRLKSLQRSQRRKLIAAGWDPKGGKQQKVKRSNNWYRDHRKLQRQYAKLDNRKDARAIQISHQILSENKTVVIQNEQISKWKSTSHGKKVQHGILGRLKTRLKNSEQVHTMSEWVPTTKFCPHCGRKWEDIKESDRHYICPHCGYDGGIRDGHSGRNMLWFFNNMREYIGLDGSEFTRADFNRRLRELFPDTLTGEGLPSDSV